LLGLLLALLLPSAWLAQRAWSQLGYETLHRYRLGGEALGSQLALDLTERLSVLLPLLDERRGPLPAAASGVLGPFRLTASGTLLPAAGNAVLAPELQARIAGLLTQLAPQPTLADREPGPTTGNAMQAATEDAAAAVTGPAPYASAPRASFGNQQAFDQLTARPSPKASRAQRSLEAEPGEAEELATALALDQRYLKRRGDRDKDRAIIAAPVAAEMRKAKTAAERQNLSWLAASQLDPEAQLVGTDHVLLFRRIWLEDAPALRGILVPSRLLLDPALARTAAASAAFPGMQLSLVDGVRVVSGLPATGPGGGSLLHRARLPQPLDQLALVFSAAPAGLPVGGAAILGISALLLLILVGGLALLYRAGLGELERRASQQNFVSAVSHELKSPLTAIRMYGEMLTNGWVSEARKPSYYAYIYSESERLSRLISNVLRLSALSRGPVAVDLAPHRIDALMSMLEPKLQALAATTDIDLVIDWPEVLAPVQLDVDEDALTQILTNLLDNAAKFAGGDGRRAQVTVLLQGLPSNLPSDARSVRFAVRDQGPGVPAGARDRIFELFYRGEDELTRQTRGTGIGLALVAELTAAMRGQVSLTDRSPGSEFAVTLPVVPAA
jgi:signal transduction histidine kinase